MKTIGQELIVSESGKKGNISVEMGKTQNLEAPTIQNGN